MSLLDNMQLEEHKPDELEMLTDTTSKVYFLIETYKLWDSDGCFTFPDGDIWHRDQHPLFWGSSLGGSMKCKLTVEQLQDKAKTLENHCERGIRAFLAETGVPECQLRVTFGPVKYGPTGGTMQEAYTTVVQVSL